MIKLLLLPACLQTVELKLIDIEAVLAHQMGTYTSFGWKLLAHLIAGM